MSADPAPAPAPIIVSALFAPADHAWLDGLRRAYFPPERNQLAAHLTLFHHLPPSSNDELRQRLSTITRSLSPPQACTAGLLSLGRGVAIRVNSPALQMLRAELADAFAGLLTPQDAAGWRPHVTIQNKASPAEARALITELGRTWDDRPVRISGLGAFFYRGGPWEPLSRHMFAG